MFKEWKNMTPEEKKTEKIAISIMGFIVIVILLLFMFAVSGCHNHTHQYEDTYIPRTTQYKDSTIIYLGDSCAARDSIMEEMKMDCGE